MTRPGQTRAAGRYARFTARIPLQWVAPIAYAAVTGCANDVDRSAIAVAPNPPRHIKRP